MSQPKIVLNTNDLLREHGVPIGVLQSNRPEIPAWEHKFYTRPEDIQRIAAENGIKNYKTVLWVGLDSTLNVAVGSQIKITTLYDTDEVVIELTRVNFLKVRDWAFLYGREDELYIVDADKFGLPDYEYVKERLAHFDEFERQHRYGTER
ncbi:MAG: hypothetical protein UV61_C0001G0077 [Candidatus Gottesmanbacteria bacterium GW2011_GWB1_43_11]|uniref:Uncharacterized protein n=1 Tax=Candidatus Gottesmanbacteria bacterium GW2011_GWB1_43_11 TaxID=1618446 RepID=A0A0G1CPN2_9BACT|nr:MAG: hypothetical protein UV04_C0004G0019 [Candidatus Gottesmanbacteria bacterium GW2011_GWA2_42_16]KKS56042.1 MAG: hypothetical protein UV17_C0003G0014 [Candidatus Gottesmanbacteria bacterium GW2011_GWA1_42_26]KKS81646.1 MAG: hypothetical protein UV55_C0011G0040 [Candidatus Gottesmanbacteria bacterium GW2011_GWC1_43_10]KKS87670.1 MAG: hypothetical protein UV61_C0001G0077 [Candidatus Gottesmanbacteria bacterium GW2011_GWB1_43_11]OGG07485.1 MAG: hypothetical protein A2699_00360 [Candidatus Go